MQSRTALLGDTGACDNILLNGNLLQTQITHSKLHANYQEIIGAMRSYEYGIRQYFLFISSQMKLYRQTT